MWAGFQSPVDILAVNTAISELEQHQPEAAQVVLLRIFGGLTIPEIAEVIDRSERSVHNRWRFGKAFLTRHIRSS